MMHNPFGTDADMMDLGETSELIVEEEKPESGLGIACRLEHLSHRPMAS